MPEEVDEFGIPIKKTPATQEVDEFGIPLKKKEPTPLTSGSPLLSSDGALPSTAGNLDSSTNLDYFQGGNTLNLTEVAPEQAKGLPPETTLDPNFQPVQDGKFIDTPEKKVTDTLANNPDLLRAASSPATTTAKDQVNYDKEFQKKLLGGQKQEALLRGTMHLANSVLKTPAFLYDAAAAVTNKVINEPLNYITGGRVGYMPSSMDISKNMPDDLKTTKALDEAIAQSKKEVYDKEYDKMLNEYFYGKNKDYEKGFEALGLGVLENAPTMLALMFGNAAGATAVESTLAGTAVFGADKMSQVEKENPEMPLLNQVAASTGSGMLEGIGESLFGVAKIGSIAKEVFLKEGAEVAAKVAKDGFVKTYGKLIARYVGVGAEEVTSEMATQFAQNLNDIYTGVNPDLDPWSGVADAGLLALGSSVSAAGPVAIMDIAKTKNSVKRAAEIVKTQESLNEDLQSPDVSEEAKPVIVNKILDLNEEASELAASEKKAFDALTEEGQEEVDSLIEQSRKISDAANDPSISETTQEVLKKDVDAVEKAIEQIYETKKKPTEEETAIIADEESSELDFLRALNEEVGLDTDQSVRLSELEEKVPKKQEFSNKDITAIEKEILDNKNKWFSADQNDKQAYIDYRLKNDELTKKLQEAKSKTVKQDGKETKQTEEAEVLTTQEAAIPQGEVAATTQPAATTQSKTEVTKAPDHFVKNGDKITTYIHKKKVEGVVTGVGKNKGQIVVDFTDSDGNQRFTYAHQIENIESGNLQLPSSKPTENVTETIGQEKTPTSEEQVALDTTEQEESPAEKKKPVKLVDELLEEEQDDVKDTPEALQKLDDEITMMKSADKKAMDAKFQGMLERAYKMREEGKISRPTYTEFKNRMKDVYQGKKNIKAEEMKIQSTIMMNKVKEKLLGQGYKNMALSSTIPINPRTVADMLDMTNAIIHKIIDAGAGAVSLAQATARALKVVKNHPTYKRLVASKELNEAAFEAELGKVKEEKKEEPKEKVEPSDKGDGKEKKSLMNRLINSTGISAEVKDIIEKYGLTYDKFSNKEANEISTQIIKDEGIEEALNKAENSTDIPGSVKTMIYANAMNHYYEKENSSKSKEDKNDAAVKQGIIADKLDRFLRDSGRAISGVQEFYKLSPAGIASKEIAGLRRENDREARRKGLTEKKNNILDALREVEDVTERKPADRSKIKKIREKRNSLLEDLKKSFSSSGKGVQMKSSFPLRDEQVVLIAKIAGTYIEEGTVRVEDLIKKIKAAVKKSTGFKITNDDLEKVMNTKVNERETLKERVEKESARTPLTEKEKAAIKEKQLSVLNTMLPKPRAKTVMERKKDHEKILQAYNNGAFDGASRTYKGLDGKETSETFEDLIYEKMGLVNVNKPEFRQKVSEFAKEVAKTPKDSKFLRNQAYQSLYNYISQFKTKTRVASAANLAQEIWYANILSSYETHFRNNKYNVITLGVNQSMLLAQKALLRGKPSEFLKIASDGLKAFATGWAEGREVLVNGAVSRFDKPGVRGMLENSNNRFLALHKIPGRLLRAADIALTVPLYEAKQRELMYAYVKSEAKKSGQKISDKEVEKRVVEYLSRTPDRVRTAEKTAAKDIEEVFGKDWKDDKKATNAYRIRVSEIMEETRPAAVKEEAIQWAKRSLLTNEPRGIYKNLSTALKEIGDVPGGKIIIPFVDVMMNMVDKMIERTPIGFVNVARGKKGFGKNMETLTEDESKELLLKAINYTVGVAALMLFVNRGDDDDEGLVITGKNTGSYSKDMILRQGGDKDPYSVYINGVKIMEYKDSPLSSLFAPVGYTRDYQKYGEHPDQLTGYIKAGFDYMTFVIDQNAMKGLNEFMNAVSPEQYREMDVNKISKGLASSAQNLFVPNIVKAVNNDVRGAFGYNDMKAEEWYDAFFKDVPFVEDLMLGQKYDHLGAPIKDQFKVPLSPYEKWQPVDEFYKLFIKHGFYPSYMKDKTVVVGNEEYGSEKFTEVELDKDQVRAMHAFRGEIIKSILKDKDDEGVTLMKKLDKLDDDKFKKEMSSIFSKAGKIAKTRLFDGKEVKGKMPTENEIDEKMNDIEIQAQIKRFVSTIDE
jgi:hypothetical protein